ncbi:DUF72 domain-containing protein [Motilimonas sp. E26]|uniref:DUF72 domain-containing protein n=1 Tax=Motilimonas TaxID=1914248 RepID=UPI001E3C6B47|nr:DUF72 domain-containing protein [Motilimonas sp. E26]
MQNTSAETKLRIGMAMWSEKAWQPRLTRQTETPCSALYHYSRVFNSVEGNTTFYALPTPAAVAKWRQDTPEDFKFSLKLPQTISHQKRLCAVSHELSEFFNLFAPLQHKIGLVKLQLPASFGPDDLPLLMTFLKQLPRDWQYGVEVRHLAYFAKGEIEKRFNGFLIEQQMNRIIMDSRPVFLADASNPVIQHGQTQKPKVPVHAIATSNQPVVRFIGDIALENNRALFLPWVSKIQQWLKQGKSPYLYVHTADNLQAPELAAMFAEMLGEPAAWFNLPEPEFDQLAMF